MPDPEECWGRFISRKHNFLHRNLIGSIGGGDGSSWVGGNGGRRRQETVMRFVEKINRLKLWVI